MSKLPCVCNHPRKDHYSGGQTTGIVILPEVGDHWCCACDLGGPAFHTFRVDNLRYLEEKYEKKLSMSLWSSVAQALRNVLF